YDLAGAPPQLAWLRGYPLGRSITELEFEHGALRFPGFARPVFLLRGEEYVSSLPAAWRADFVDDAAEPANMLRALRERAELSPGADVVHYEARWAGARGGRGVLGGLDDM